MNVIKKLLIAFLVIYVVITSTYFIYKYAPYSNSILMAPSRLPRKHQKRHRAQR